MKTILIVEDEQLLRNNLEEMLGAAGYNTVAAQNGKDALDKLKEGTPDLVLSDIKMPEMDGLELLSHLHNRSEYLDIPFILLTAKTEITDIRKGLSLGAVDYVIKPFSYTGLLKSIETRIKRGNTAQEDKRKSDLFSKVLNELSDPFFGTCLFNRSTIDDLDKLKHYELKEIVESIQSSELKYRKEIEKLLTYIQTLISLKDNNAKLSLRNNTSAINMEFVNSLLDSTVKKYDRSNDMICYIDEACLKIDKVYLTHIINELIENSLAHSMKESPVSILGINLGKNYIFHVNNAGGGIAMRNTFKLNSSSGSTGEKENKHRSGLGLLIIRKITELFGCMLEIESEIGLYSKVNIKIPILEIEK